MLLEKWQAMAKADTPPEVLTRERLLWTLQDETLEQRDLLDAMRAGTPGSGLAVDADLFVRQCDACLGHDSYDRLREIQQETLVLCGRQDQLTPPRLHRELADELPNAELVTLPYGAHLVLVESAQRLNQTVLDFLAR